MDTAINASALRRADLVRLLNGTNVAKARAAQGLGRITTSNTVSKWIEAGAPTNADGSVSLLELCAWLATRQKDAAMGRDVGMEELRRQLLEAKVDREKITAEAQKRKHQVDTMADMLKSGAIVRREAVERAWLEMLRVQLAVLDAELDRLPPRVQGRSLVEVRKLKDKLKDSIRERFRDAYEEKTKLAAT